MIRADKARRFLEEIVAAGTAHDGSRSSFAEQAADALVSLIPDGHVCEMPGDPAERECFRCSGCLIYYTWMGKGGWRIWRTK